MESSYDVMNWGLVVEWRQILELSLFALLRSTSIFIESDHSLCFGLNIKLNPKHSSRGQSKITTSE